MLDAGQIERVAAACHEANRLWCEAVGDDSQFIWDYAEDWQRLSAIDGVEFALANPDAPPSAQHDSWMAAKISDGWVYGETKDGMAKTHPCLVPFDQLPIAETAKDHIFRAVVAGAVAASK